MVGRGKTVPEAGSGIPRGDRKGGKTIPGAGNNVLGRGKTVPGGGKTIPGECKNGPGGKTIPKQYQSSKRSRRRAMINDPGVNDHERGEICGEGEDLVWKNIQDGSEEWIPAVYHNDIRAKLLAQASENGRLSYDHPRKHGYLPHDETAFLESQQHWGGDRSLWHLIPDDILNRLDRKDRNSCDYEGRNYELEYMFDENDEGVTRIVLDMDNHPVIAYEDVPSVLSSQFATSDEGWLMEAIQRIDRRIQRADFWARMPWQRKTTPKGKVEPLFGLSSIGNRSNRWREKAGVVAWLRRDGSENLRKFIIGLLSEEGIANNTTRELTKDLTKEQLKEAKNPNKGKMMSKAGTRLIPDDVRKARAAKVKKLTKRSATKRVAVKRKSPEQFDVDVAVDNDHGTKRRKANTDGKHFDNTFSSPLTSLMDQSLSAPQEAPAVLGGVGSSSHDGAGKHHDRFSEVAAIASYLETNVLAQDSTYPCAFDDASSTGDAFAEAEVDPFAVQISATPGTQTENQPFGFTFDNVPNDSQAVRDLDGQYDEGSIPLIFDNTQSDDILDPLYGLAVEPHLTPSNAALPWSPPLAAATTDTNSSLKRNREDDEEYQTSGSDARPQKRHKFNTRSEHLGSPRTQRATTPFPRQPTTPHLSSSTSAPYTHENSLMTGLNSPGTPFLPGHPNISPPGPTNPSSSSTTNDQALPSEDTSTSILQPPFSTTNTTTTTTPTTPPTRDLPPNTTDYRFLPPQNPTEARHIAQALTITRHAFTSLFGTALFGADGPPTRRYDSYARQYASIQLQAAMLQPAGGEMVYLDHWGAWGGGFEGWVGTRISRDGFVGVVGLGDAVAQTEDEDGDGDGDGGGDGDGNDDVFDLFTTGI